MPGITYPKGFRAAGIKCGLKEDETRLDLSLIVADQPVAAGAVFTQNRIVAAPVELCHEHLAATQQIRAIVINSGNANCCTGKQGYDDAVAMARMTADHVGCDPNEVLVASTGIIGEFMPMDCIESGIAAAINALSTGDEADRLAAEGILTTDTKTKYKSSVEAIGGSPVRLGGMSKGAAMMGPNMATMLAFMTTDAAIEADHLQALTKHIADQTYNRVIVEGHTSTNDTFVVLASGQSGVQLGPDTPEWNDFVDAALRLNGDLARKMAQDAEGSTKLVTINVSGCASEADADAIARTIALSALVKTAIFGNDPNWGRISSAAGYAGVPFDVAGLTIRLLNTAVFERGEPATFDRDALTAAMRDSSEISIDVELTEGDAACTLWTCDLTRDYVTLNADYTT